MTFTTLRQTLQQCQGKYFDEWSENIYDIERIVFTIKDTRILVSTYKEGDKYFTARPLLVMDDKVVLRDFPSERILVKDLDLSGSTMRDNYTYWFIISYQDFIDGVFPFTIVSSHEAQSTKNNIFYVNDIIETNDLFVQGKTIILPIKSSLLLTEEHRELYDRTVKLFGGESHWYDGYFHIYADTRLKIVNGVLMYYLDNIYGNYRRNPYHIVVQDGKLVALEGTLDLLSNVLTILESQGTTKPRILTYKRRTPRYITDSVHNWIIKGCPNIGLSYKLIVAKGKLSISSLTHRNVKLEFIGPSASYLTIIDGNTKRRWTFTDNYNYANVEVSGSRFLHAAPDCYSDGNGYSKYVTKELADEAVVILDPIKALLESTV
jgi:hypothetical protein